MADDTSRLQPPAERSLIIRQPESHIAAVRGHRMPATHEICFPTGRGFDDQERSTSERTEAALRFPKSYQGVAGNSRLLLLPGRAQAQVNNKQHQDTESLHILICRG